MRVEALFISDVHLGSRGCKAEELLEVLKMYDPENLFIVGDFIDGWLLKKRHYWPQSHTNVIRKVLSYSKKGTNVFYITGNHDDFLRAYDHLSFGNIVIADEIIFKGAWITHGDKFDSIVMYKKWLAVLGSAGYEITIVISEYVKKLRKFLGLKPRSFSKWIKSKVKGAVSFIDSFEYTLTKEATLKNCETVICGHIHTPADKRIGNSRYLNTGDWIENYSYIVYQNGKFTLNYYETERLGDNSHTRKK